MKKIYFLLLSIFSLSLVSAQGTENFANSNATTSYANGSFVGAAGITWTYVASRDANGDANGSGINLPALMLRRVSDGSKITSSSISGGISDFSVKLYKGFTGGGNRQVELFVNGVSRGLSTPFDNFTEQTFTVTGINVAGNITIELVNTTSTQVIIDDITWTGFSTSCGVVLGQPSYSCLSNTVGDNNDTVTVNIPYTGFDAGITSVTTSSGGTVQGDDPSTTPNGIITVTGLTEGDAWDIVLNGGDCDTFTSNGTVAPAECDPIPNTCFDLSNGTETFEIVTVTPNTAGDEWTLNSGTYSLNAFCGSGCQEAIDAWMVFGPLDMTGVTDLSLALNAAENFGVTDLNINYTSAYTGCPSSTSWTTAQTLTDAGSYNIDLSTATGTEVFIGVQYSDDGVDGYSGWELSDVNLNAFNACPSLGMRPTSDCAICDVILQTESYVCATNTEGDNNDQVTINIPYTGSDNTITSVTTTTTATISGDDPATTVGGTIILTGLGEGDSWNITLNGGDCDGTSLSGTVPAANCDPVFLIINEIHADPDATNGDANGDGTVNTSDDEFIEIYNSGTVAIDLSDYVIADAVSDRHTFPSGTILPPNNFITVFGGGTPTGIDFIAQTASTTGLGLNNGGDTVTIRDNNGVNLIVETYGAAGNNQSIARNPDFTGVFVDHSTIASNPVLFSPGAKNDGTTLSTKGFNITNFSIYPNPVSNGTVTIKTTANDVVTVNVFNVLGKRVISKALTNDTLDVSQLSTGLYLIKLTQNGASTTKKLVVE
ncbi:lamin tail domain-containing protein [Lacinutrix sp. Hel_I_90]|uniref:lamin tail domain-containing protein n=1 Tax=Lacinutrix sp. Hel_I_90 TaxID=1249999 RepID=UPI00069660A7|nr:lamin tail domain-containing protein [Lacinutrix sp. Hel_I_90]